MASSKKFSLWIKKDKESPIEITVDSNYSIKKVLEDLKFSKQCRVELYGKELNHDDLLMDIGVGAEAMLDVISSERWVRLSVNNQLIVKIREGDNKIYVLDKEGNVINQYENARIKEPQKIVIGQDYKFLVLSEGETYEIQYYVGGFTYLPHVGETNIEDIFVVYEYNRHERSFYYYLKDDILYRWNSHGRTDKTLPYHPPVKVKNICIWNSYISICTEKYELMQWIDNSMLFDYGDYDYCDYDLERVPVENMPLQDLSFLDKKNVEIIEMKVTETCILVLFEDGDVYSIGIEHPGCLPPIKSIELVQILSGYDRSMGIEQHIVYALTRDGKLISYGGLGGVIHHDLPYITQIAVSKNVLDSNIYILYSDGKLDIMDRVSDQSD